MKKFILIFIILPNLLFAFIDNLQLEETILRGARYEATLLEHNNRLYVDARGAIEEYNILPDGSLELNSYILKTHYEFANAKIIDNTLYVANNAELETETDIYRIDLSGDEMQIIDIQTIQTGYGLFRFDVNDDYFIYVNSGQIDAQVLDRETFEYVTTVEAGGYFEVRNNHLFREMSNGYLSILDISDIHNPTEIGSVYIGEYEQNASYCFQDSYLFIGQNQRIAIIDISDITDPQLVSTITDIPSTPTINHFTDIETYGNYLIFKNKKTKLWLYNISEISNPDYISTITSYSSSSSSKESMIILNNFLYLSSISTNIMRFNLEELPAMGLIGEYGNYGRYHFFDFASPYLFLNDPYNDEFLYFDVLDQESEIITLSNSTYSYCFNDSLLCFFEKITNNDYDLTIYKSNDEELIFKNTIDLTEIYTDVEFVGNHLILTQKETGLVEICTIQEDYSINILASHNVETWPFIVNSIDSCTDDFIYIKSNNYDLNMSYIDIFENYGFFELVATYDLNIFGNNFDNIYRLADDKVVLSEYHSVTYLCDYVFPDGFEYTDFINTTGNFRLFNDFLIWWEDYGTVTELYSWQNDEFEEIFSYDFGREISNIFIIPDTNILYATGRYSVLKYSFDYTNSEDEIIPANSYQLSNHPNPFNPSAAGAGRSPSTTISFNLTTSLRNASARQADSHEDTQIEIYNLKGQKVKEFQITNYELGINEVVWNGKNDNGKPVASGVYFYQLKINNKPVASEKCLLLK